MSKSKREKIKQAVSVYTDGGKQFGALLGKNTKTTKKKLQSKFIADIKSRESKLRNNPPISSQGTPKSHISISDTPDRKFGFVKFPYSVTDSLFPKLKTECASKSVYSRLIRIVGNTNKPIIVGYQKLMRACNQSINTVQRAMIILQKDSELSRNQIHRKNSLPLWEYDIPKTNGNYFTVSNTVFDYLFPKIKPIEQSMYLILWRLSFGLEPERDRRANLTGRIQRKNRNHTYPLGYTELQELSGLSKNGLVSTMKKLLTIGVIEVVDRERNGTVYKIVEPHKIDICKDSIAPNERKSIISFEGTPKPHTSKQGTTNKNGEYLKAISGIPPTDNILSSLYNLEHHQEEKIDDALKLLTKNGITETMATKLAREFPKEYLIEKIQIIQKRNSDGKVSNLAGSIVQAIRQNWISPDIQAEKHRTEEKRKKNELNKKRISVIRKKISNGEFIKNREYDLLPEKEQEFLSVDKSHYQTNGQWRYSKVG